MFDQVGVTPEGVEVPRSLVDKEMKEKLSAMPKEFQPYAPTGPDPKWRYMWRVGPRPSETRFKVKSAEYSMIGFVSHLITDLSFVLLGT